MFTRTDVYPHVCRNLPAQGLKMALLCTRIRAAHAVKNRGLLNRARYAIADTDR